MIQSILYMDAMVAVIDKPIIWFFLYLELSYSKVC